MKTLLASIIFIILASNSFAIDTLKTKVSKATVYFNGAQVFRKSRTTTIKKGVNEIIIKDVSPYLIPNRIQAGADGSFMILDVKFVTEYVASQHKAVIIPEKIQNEMDALKDTLLFISFEKERIQAKLTNLFEEKNMVMKNQLIASGGISDTLPEFKEIVAFYRFKLDEIHELVHKWKKLDHYCKARESKHQLRYNELANYSNNIGQPVQQAKTRYHIQVTTYSEYETSGKVEVNYMVNNAGWIPAYDLRADNTSEPMNITYKASVFQNSGEDWEDVDLTLSTYNQNSNAVKPTLGIWRLDYTINKPVITSQPGITTLQYSQNMISNVDARSAENELKEVYGDQVETNVSYIPNQALSAVNENVSNVEFDVKLPYSIKADGQHKLMVIMNKEVDANFEHYMLPRVDNKAYLLAKIDDWENMDLMSGQANIYFNQTFVGSTYLNPSSMKDTMEITMGSNDRVVSKRRKVDETVKKATLTKRTTRTLTFEIEVWNKSRTSIDLELEDQIPVTSNEDIKIKLVDGGGGVHHNETDGMLTWKLKLKPGEKRTIEFSYSIEHEKDKPVS